VRGHQLSINICCQRPSSAANALAAAAAVDRRDRQTDGRFKMLTAYYKGGSATVTLATLSGNSLRQTVHTHRASVHQAAKLVATLLRVARVTVGLAESNGSLPPGL